MITLLVHAITIYCSCHGGFTVVSANAWRVHFPAASQGPLNLNSAEINLWLAEKSMHATILSAFGSNCLQKWLRHSFGMGTEEGKGALLMHGLSTENPSPTHSEDFLWWQRLVCFIMCWVAVWCHRCHRWHCFLCDAVWSTSNMMLSFLLSNSFNHVEMYQWPCRQSAHLN